MITTVTLNASVDKRYEIDHLQAGTVMRVHQVSNTAGGKGMNVARVAALISEDVTVMGFVGGHNGELFRSLIHEDRIHCRFTTIKGETRCCINVHDTEHNMNTEFLEPGAEVDEAALQRFFKEFEEQLDKTDVVTLSGSLPYGVPKDVYAQLVTLAQKKGKKTVVDSSGEALRLSIAAHPTMIKPNADELSQLFGVSDTSEKKCIELGKKLNNEGVAIVAISRGKDGVLVVCDEGVYRGIPPALHTVNTVGCGDSMVAGFAAAMTKGLSMEEAIRLAVSVSAANALNCDTGCFAQEELEAIRPKVIVEKLG